jgi:hypothetical protein
MPQPQNLVVFSVRLTQAFYSIELRSCGRHLSQNYSKNASKICHRGHGGASVCVSSIKVHIRIHWTCNQGVRKWFKPNCGSVLVGVRWLLAHPVYNTLTSYIYYKIRCQDTLWNPVLRVQVNTSIILTKTERKHPIYRFHCRWHLPQHRFERKDSFHV